MSSIWDFSKEEQEKMAKAGIDYDLSACLEYNGQSFDITDIEKVLAVWTGERDEEDWRWVIKVTKQCADKNGGSFVFLQGGCDYTGWDCQSYAKSTFTKTALKAAECAKVAEGVTVQDYTQAGMGHMLSLLGGEAGKNFNQVYDELVKQLKTNKSKTWRESKDEELGVNELPKI